MIGYPEPVLLSAADRACGAKKSRTNYLILDHLPMDQYIGLEPGWLFDESSEHAVIDPDNLLIELAHIRAAAAELPLSLDDIAASRISRDDSGTDEDAGSAKPERSVCMGRRRVSAGDFSMRNIDKNKYTLLNQETGKTITEMDESQAFREIRRCGLYRRESYKVVKMDLESKMAYAIPFN